MSHKLVNLLLGVAAIAVVAGLAFGWFQYKGSVSGGDAADLVTQAVRAGDFGEAITNSVSIQQSPDASVDEKALAAFNALGAEFRLTADIKARLADIQKMKDIINDSKVSLRTRVNTLNAFANQYSISGRDPAVFAEMYKDAPFKSYLAPNDPDLSARRLFEWSYSLMPTSFAAILIARWHSEQPLTTPEMEKKAVEGFAAITRDYLNRADTAVAGEEKAEATYKDSTRYLVYRYWRAIIIGRLAVIAGEPYKSQYKAEFTNFISFAQTQKNVLAADYLLYARLFFAQRLAQDNDSAGAKAQLDTLAKDMQALSNPDAVGFVRFLRNESETNSGGLTWSAVKAMSLVSANFKAAVDKIIISGSAGSSTSY